MGKNDFKKTIKKAIFIADALERLVKISCFIDDMAEGIEEIEKSIHLSKNNNLIKEYLSTDKNKKK